MQHLDINMKPVDGPTGDGGYFVPNEFVPMIVNNALPLRKFTMADVAAMMKTTERIKLPIIDKQGRLWDAPNVPSAMTSEEYRQYSGGYIINNSYLRTITKIIAWHSRRERKVWKRYQRQKSKQ